MIEYDDAMKIINAYLSELSELATTSYYSGVRSRVARAREKLLRMPAGEGRDLDASMMARTIIARDNAFFKEPYWSPSIMEEAPNPEFRNPLVFCLD
jgi:hypothetical protein